MTSPRDGLMAFVLACQGRCERFACRCLPLSNECWEAVDLMHELLLFAIHRCERSGNAVEWLQRLYNLLHDEWWLS